MRKLLTCLLSAGILLSMSGCSKSSSDKALDATVTGLNNMVNMESASYSAGMTLNVMGENMTFDIHGGYLEKDDKLNISALVDIEESGAKQNVINAYIKDDFLYLDMAGEKAKMSLTDIINSFSQSTAGAADKKGEGIKKDDIKPYIKDAKMDGSKIELILDEKQVEKAVQDSVNESAATDGAETTVKVQNATITLEVKDDFIVDAAFDMKTKMNVSLGQGADANADMNFTFYMKFADINANKDIEFPAFGEEYIEIDLMDLIGALGQEL